ncbi:MAG: 2-dehydropantoate 2-reductase [Polyangiaceae bacterium]
MPKSIPPVAEKGPRFLVVGAGGIGGIVAAYLLEQGHDVTTLSTNGAIRDAIAGQGFRIRGDGSIGTVPGRAVAKLSPGEGKFDFILLATQPPDVERAARDAAPFLKDEGALVCFQNGLCEDRVAPIVGRSRVIGGIVAWGATMVEPGVYDRTSSGGFQLGTLDGADDDRLRALGRALECIGPVVLTQNLVGARWSKLAINCAISALGTVGGDRLGVLMRNRYVRRLTLELMTEVVDVARATNVRLEKVSGTLDLDWIALTDEDRRAAGSASLFAKHALLLAVGARYRRLKSSMLSAIERGRTPAVDFLNGEVVTRGQKLGIPTPINAAIRDEVWAIANGKARSSEKHLRGFFDRTRPLVEPDALRVSKEAAAKGAPPARSTEEAEPLPGALASSSPPSSRPVAAAATNAPIEDAKSE